MSDRYGNVALAEAIAIKRGDGGIAILLDLDAEQISRLIPGQSGAVLAAFEIADAADVAVALVRAIAEDPQGRQHESMADLPSPQGADGSN